MPEQTTDLRTIGQILQQKREEHSYTLEHVAEITRITPTALKQIEEGNMEGLPGLVFVRGFVRNYARLLGLESDWMIEALNQAYAPQDPSQPTPDRETVLKQEATPTASKKLFITTGVLTASILIVLFVFWNFKSIDRYSLDEGSVETVQAVDTREPPPAEVQSVIEPVLPEPATITPAPPVKPEISPLTLTLIAMEDEWIQLVIDEQPPVLSMLSKGTKYEWPANHEYTLTMTTGNTALVYLNGEEIIDRENYPDELYQVNLNRFTLTRINH
jgi:cytoskeletal protein RodZ